MFDKIRIDLFQNTGHVIQSVSCQSKRMEGESSPYGFRPEFTPTCPANPVLLTNHPPCPSKAFRWVDSCSSYGSVPPGAVQGGTDIDGHPIYVGRSYHGGDLLPAKVLPTKNAAYVAYSGEELLVEHYQVLCQPILEWVPCQSGLVPPGAVPGGHTSSGEPLFIGRAYHQGSQTVGKIHPSHGCCYIPFGGQEVSVCDYEVLVSRL